ncbi:M20/M25/M40 family metallo-hydrolase [Brevundimonas sp. Root1279]|uniref:M20/M25/M40 family metallo-hydrolase n=1 Tax=Brevundimonas sp. Root1279 TaxID=1736443 RepID=UPI0006F73C23|nr:M20/M25/M40 family metallo-hydrolase [Brevundimonas sp. Root1279]KQW82520.1 peptidase M20 [Brevundimonas sp. Root1279]
MSKSTALAGLVLLAVATPALAEDPSPRADQLAFRDLYEELIETNTTLSEGSCTLASERMAARLLDAGLPAADVRVLASPDRPKDGNLAAVLHGSDPTAEPILLLAHIDVVEARREDWDRDPFTLVEEGGYFYARGAHDDKAQAAIWVDTLARLKQQGFTPRRDIKIALTCGEETSDTWNGVEWLLEHHPDALRAGFALNEGARGRLDTEGDRVALDVQAGEKIYQDYRLEVTNPGGHSSRPLPDNAIYRLSNALTRLEAYSFPTEPNPAVQAYFTAMADATPAHAADMRLIAAAGSPDVREAAAQRLSAADPAWNAVLRTTCVATMVDAGHAPNALPQRAVANVNCRILPGHDPHDVRADLERVLADPGVVVTMPGKIDPTSPPPPLTPAIMEPITRVAGQIWPGVPVVPSMSPGATDGRFTNAAGIPTYGIQGLFVDPDGAGVHGLNERIRVRSLYEGRDFLFELVKAYAE